MKVLYTTGIRLYGMVARVAAIRSDKATKFVKGRKKALAELSRLTAERAPDGYDYWFHAASLGEFEQARPLIEDIRQNEPESKILLTFFSPSGYEIRKNYPLATTVTYLPPDTPGNVRKFLDIARPHKAIFVKYEFWINMLTELKRREIPTYIISAIFRRGQIFFKPWGGLFRKGLHCYTRLFVQDENSKALLNDIGIDKVTVAGDTRFDRVADITKTGKEFPNIEAWCKDSFTLIAGSSWGPDELRYFPWLNGQTDVKAIIAPHEFDDERLSQMRKSLHGRSMLWSELKENEPIPGDITTLIIDSFGLLSSIYRYADAVIVGGGFGTGIHNINEAAAWGVPVIFGPKHSKFKEAGDLIQAGGAFEYSTADEVASLLTRLKEDEALRKSASDASARYIAENIGATQQILTYLRNPDLRR